MKKIFVMAIVFQLAVTSAFASGFGIFVQGAEGLGQGNAVIAHPAGASSAYFNPALLTRLEDRASLEVGTTAVLSDRSFTSDLTGLTTDADDKTYYPSTFYFQTPIGGSFVESLGLTDARFGLAVNAPFGLGTNWPQDWEGRYIATENEIMTININPSLALQIGEEWSLAFGVDILSFEIDANRNFPTAVFGVLGLGLPDIKIKAEGETWAFGYNAALAWRPTDTIGFGVSYRSEFDVDLDRDDLSVTFDSVPSSLASYFNDTRASTNLELPAQLTLGAACQFTPAFLIEVAARWEDWSVFDEQLVIFEQPILVGVPGLETNVDFIPRNWDDTWSYSVGAKYKIDHNWTVLAGYLFSETAVPDSTFDPSIPGADADLYTLGISFERERWSIDVAYGLQDNDKRRKNNAINDISLAVDQPANGIYETRLDLVSASFEYKF